jgi:flagellar motor protein MotB
MRELAWAALVVAGLAACGGAPIHAAALGEAERVRLSPGAREGAELAPETYARAEQERELARRADASGDEVGSALHAERAIAAYGHALVVARLARAGTELADAKKSLDDARAQGQMLDASRAKLDEDAAELEKRLQIARERLLPAPSAATSGEREAARLSAARSLAVEARLLCSAASLVASDAAGLAETAADVAKLEQRLKDRARAQPAPIDDATRVRALCLDVLTRARRTAGGDDGRTDALLSELSASGAWEPARDERGVVVTLRGLFRGARLTDGGMSKLKELGHIAAAHADFAIEVVVHDAQPPAETDDLDARRAAAALEALIAGGAAAPRVKTELAGARAPVADPNDAKGRARNERLEVVFVYTVASLYPKP